MGLSASQARFLALTARKSNVEYKTQQINQQRLRWSEKLEQASAEYQEATSDRKLVFRLNTGSEVMKVDVTYNNYKSYMNKQLEDLSSSQPQMFLVSSSGNKIVVSSEEDMQAIIDNAEIGKFNKEDFMIVEGLDDVTNFQKALRDGIYFFATYEEQDDKSYKFNAKSWETVGAGAISEEYDKANDAAAQAKYDAETTRIKNIDKKLELEINQLESERNAIQTEMESVKKVVDNNIEKTFQAFS